jgi:hypothetical protein
MLGKLFLWGEWCMPDDDDSMPEPEDGGLLAIQEMFFDIAALARVAELSAGTGMGGEDVERVLRMIRYTAIQGARCVGEWAPDDAQEAQNDPPACPGESVQPQ